MQITCRINGQSRSEPESVWPQGEQKVIPFFYYIVKKDKSLKITDNTVYTRSHPHNSKEKLDDFYFFSDFSPFRLEIKCCLYQCFISRFWLHHSKEPRKIIFKYYFAPYK